MEDSKDFETYTAVNDDKKTDNRAVNGEKDEDKIVADIKDVETDTAVNDDKEADKRTIDREKDEDEINMFSQ